MLRCTKSSSGFTHQTPDSDGRSSRSFHFKWARGEWSKICTPYSLIASLARGNWGSFSSRVEWIMTSSDPDAASQNKKKQQKKRSSSLFCPYKRRFLAFSWERCPLCKFFFILIPPSSIFPTSSSMKHEVRQQGGWEQQRVLKPQLINQSLLTQFAWFSGDQDMTSKVFAGNFFLFSFSHNPFPRSFQAAFFFPRRAELCVAVFVSFLRWKNFVLGGSAAGLSRKKKKEDFFFDIIFPHILLAEGRTWKWKATGTLFCSKDIPVWKLSTFPFPIFPPVFSLSSSNKREVYAETPLICAYTHKHTHGMRKFWVLVLECGDTQIVQLCIPCLGTSVNSVYIHLILRRTITLLLNSLLILVDQKLWLSFYFNYLFIYFKHSI